MRAKTQSHDGARSDAVPILFNCAAPLQPVMNIIASHQLSLAICAIC